MTITKKKLIEVALPLEKINVASAREKSIRHGHPSTLHLWWARRPLAAARAVIFAQMVDDPSGYVDELLNDRVRRAQAERVLAERKAAWELRRQAFATAEEQGEGGLADPGEEPTLEECAADVERQRLFRLIEQLVLWENTTNEDVLNQARDEIWKSWRRTCAENKDHPRAAELFDPEKLPPFHDPFAGGGAIPLEAQRLGLESYASDLNPVAVLINKAMIEIPPKFAGKPPVNPKSRGQWRGNREQKKGASSGTVSSGTDRVAEVDGHGGSGLQTDGVISSDRALSAGRSTDASSGVGAGKHRGRKRKGDEHFLTIAKGSLMETETFLMLAVRLSYLTQPQTQPTFDLIVEISKMLTALRQRLLGNREQ